MKTRKPRLAAKVLLTLEDIVILERLVAKAHYLTKYSIDQDHHAQLGHIADTLAEAAEDLDF